MLDKLLDKVFDFAVSPRGIVTLLSAAWCHPGGCQRYVHCGRAGTDRHAQRYRNDGVLGSDVRK